MPAWSCPICVSSKHGKFTSVCGHDICGKCLLTLHCDALEALAWKEEGRSKCPFCRQVFPFEERYQKKMRFAIDTLRVLRVRKQEYRADIQRLRRLRRTLACSLKK